MSSTQSYEYQPSQQDLEHLYCTVEQTLEGFLRLNPGIRGDEYPLERASASVQESLAANGHDDLNEVAARKSGAVDDEYGWVELALRRLSEALEPEQSLRYQILREIDPGNPQVYYYQIAKYLPTMDANDVQGSYINDATELNEDELRILDSFEVDMSRITAADVALLGALVTTLASEAH